MLKVIGVVVMLITAAGFAIGAESVRIILRDGTVVEGDLADFGSRIYRVSLPDGSSREVREAEVRDFEKCLSRLEVLLKQDEEIRAAPAAAAKLRARADEIAADRNRAARTLWAKVEPEVDELMHGLDFEVAAKRCLTLEPRFSG